MAPSKKEKKKTNKAHKVIGTKVTLIQEDEVMDEEEGGMTLEK